VLERSTAVRQNDAFWEDRYHLRAGRAQREPIWSESLAVGRREFVERVQGELGLTAQYREVVADGQAHVLREPPAVYSAHVGGARAAPE
jgi:hypothetical protein